MAHDPTDSDSAPFGIDELEARRASLRQGLARSTVAAAVVLTLAAILAGLCVLWATRARNSAEESEERLWLSLIDQAHAQRLSPELGHRSRSLKALEEAARIRRSPRMRNELIASLSLFDLKDISYQAVLSSDTDDYALSNDLRHLAIGYKNGIIRVLEVNSWSEVERYRAPSGFEWSSFSPDGRYLAVRCTNGAVYAWDRQSGKQVAAEFTGDGEHWGNSVCFHPQKPLLVYTDRHREGASVIGKNLHSQEQEFKHEVRRYAWQVDFSPDGTHLAIGAYDRVQVIDVESGHTLAEKGSGPITHVRWHPDGLRLGGACSDNTAWVTEIFQPSRYVSLVGHSNYVSTIEFTPDGELAMTRSWDGSTKIWEAGSGLELLSTDEGYGFKFDATGKQLAYVHEKVGVGFWEVQRSEFLSQLTTPRAAASKRTLYACSFSSDGRLLATAGEYGFLVWDCQARRLLHQEDYTYLHGLILKENALYTVGPNSADRWPFTWHPSDPNSFTIGERENLLKSKSQSHPLSFATPISSQSPSLAVTDFSDAYLLARPEDQCQSVGRFPSFGGIPRKHAPQNTFMAISPNLEWAGFSAWKGGGSYVWSLTNKEQKKGQIEAIGGRLEFSPDSETLVTGNNREYIFWNTEDWSRRFIVPNDFGATAVPPAIRFNPVTNLVAATRRPGQLQFLNPSTGEVVMILDALNTSSIKHITFDRDGSTMAVTNREGVQLWNLAAIDQALKKMGT